MTSNYKKTIALLLLVLPWMASSQNTCAPEDLRASVMDVLTGLDSTKYDAYKALFITEEEISMLIDQSNVTEEEKADLLEMEIEIKNKVNGFHSEDFNQLLRESESMGLEWKNIEYEEYLYRVDIRNGVKQLKGNVFFKEGERHFKVKVSAGYVDHTYRVFRLGRLSELNPPNGNTAPPEATEVVPVIEEEVVEFPDIEASFSGGAAAMKKFIEETIVYPQECIEKNIQGKIYLSFTVEKDGSLTNIVVERSVFPELDREAKRVISAMPKWIPGELNGKKVRTRINLPIIFRLEEVDSKEVEIKGIVAFPEQEPEFPGGIESMRLWFNDNVHYPDEAKEDGAYGTVYVRFVVGKSGYRSQFEILRSPHDALSKEAIRLIESMPRWTPAKQNGTSVEAWYTLPVRFVGE